MAGFKVRTDLALEAREDTGQVEKELGGVQVEEYEAQEGEVKITHVEITSKNSARVIGKPMGTYITLEAPAMALPDTDYHKKISAELSNQLKELIGADKRELSVLVVGLGNRDVTADSLGPNVVDNLLINRHMIKEFGKAVYGKSSMHMLSGLVPGVMAKTGMESVEIIRGVVEKTKPDLVLAVDALAARSVRRLNRTIQLSNTGIHPGSGVGNHRNSITGEALGVPVIAIGVPTVVDAATIVNDALQKLVERLKGNGMELKEEIREGLPELYNMYVTGKDVDYEIKQISHIICDAIHRVLEIDAIE